MSVKEFSVPGEEFDVGKMAGRFATVYLNDVFRESMKKARATCPSDIIVRCDSLPFIPGVALHFSELFDILIGLIFEMSVTTSNIILFVECEEESGTSGLQNKIHRNYIIRFHTNFSAGDEWKQNNATKLTRCNDIVSFYEGSFIVNTIKNTGCLFLIKLPANQK